MATGSDDRSVAVLRPTVTMGLGASSSLARALAAGSGRRLGDEGRYPQFLHIDDLAAAIETVAVSEYDGVVNVAPDGWFLEIGYEPFSGGAGDPRSSMGS